MLAAIPFPPLSPEIVSFSLFGMEVALRWYAMAYIVGIVLGWRLIVRTVRRSQLWPQDPVMTPGQVEDLLTWVVLGVILGGRLGFVIFYQPGYYLANPSEILMVWQGGMSFHGGLLGVVVVNYLFAWRHGLRPLWVADMMCMVAPIGVMLGRLANFINAELWGRPTDVPWGVIFPGQAAQDCADFVPGLCARHPSQLYEAGLEGLLLGGLLIFLVYMRGALRWPGLISGLFLLGYGASRFFVEFYRQADAQFITQDNPLGYALQFGGAGLSMGQILSLPMIGVGLVVILYARSRPA
ncbi:prolipoprotein diacylglyceryl transferase [Roseovarius sp. LXJ103]|uniref:prolipoprotein diacylglyceryl transferase n=1 Tax=Roseovarius carneus TaxID=2853164 RepID=UPI000D60F611|nr:prolipoprotein diacylglyceryl transferase [Roseovarius carneus]MBZ8117419.1 prolipoprotein diacylglyceryl transferase [Roseovarius carneus]PWE36772.1 prolipoprotein diacylglyceryl transferase [Pelagicola sp. LXJ1103]